VSRCDNNPLAADIEEKRHYKPQYPTMEESMTDVYRALAKHLDNLPGGYPATENGVELRILQRLFTPEEAELATCLSMIPEPVSAIARRTGRDLSMLAEMLEKMALKGLIFRRSQKDEKAYSAAMFVIGIWEYHLNDLDEGLVRDVNAYLPHIAREVWMKHETQHLRVVPISKSLTTEATVASYDDAEQLIKQQSKIVVQPCICRKEHEIAGEKCDYPVEVCLSFGTAAYYYEENKLGRDISVAEALEILETGRKAGLVIQPGNAQRSVNICMCCGCCCQALKNLKTSEKPALAIHSNYFARVDEDNCTACGVCAERCHMDAITVGDTARVNPDRCIGCGVCVPECPTDAILYLQKASPDRYVPPKHVAETYLRMAKERGLL
jgi:electron transport complex protein RnfB